MGTARIANRSNQTGGLVNPFTGQVVSNPAGTWGPSQGDDWLSSWQSLDGAIGDGGQRAVGAFPLTRFLPQFGDQFAGLVDTMPMPDNYDGSPEQRVNWNKLQQLFQQNGYQYNTDTWDGGRDDWISDASGNVVGNPVRSQYTNDNRFWNAALAAGAVTGANLYGASSGLGAVAPATGGAAAVGSTTPELVGLMEANGLTAAEIGAATGGAGGFGAADLAAMGAAGTAAGAAGAADGLATLSSPLAGMSAPAAVAPMATGAEAGLGLASAPSLGSVPATASAVAGGTGLTGAWNGTNFGGPASGASGLSGLGGALSNTKASDWLMLGGLAAGALNKPAAPDTSGINAAAQSASSIAERQQALAEKQYADQKALLDQYAPMLRQQLQASIDAQLKSNARSDASWDDYTKTWQPVEQQLAQRSLNWATPGRMEQAAQEAQAGVASQYDTARQSSREDMIRAGLDPSSMATLEASGRLSQAAAQAGAANKARRDVEQQGMAYLDNAARFGRNMPSTGLQAAALAGQQGQQVQQGYQGLSSATSAPALTASGLYGQAAASNNAAGSLYGNLAQITAQNNQASSNYSLGTLAGLAKLYGMFGGGP